MRKLIQRVALALFLLLPALAPAQNLTPEQAAQVIARVGDEDITAGEFMRDMQIKVTQITSSTGKQFNPDLRFRRAVLDEIINNRILNIAARNSGLKVSDEEVETDFQERKKVFDSEEKYQNYLKRSNMTEADLRDAVRTRLQVKKFVDQETGVLTASEEEIAALYEKLNAQGKMKRTEVTRDLGVMLFRAQTGTDEAWLAAEERAKAAKARLDAGETFDAVAREVSEDPVTAPEGGLLREMRIGSFYPELEAALKDLAPGAVSAPVRSVMGWYLITIVSENEPGTIPLDTVRKRLETEIIEGKRRETIIKIVEQARTLIRVEVMDAPMAPSAPAPAPAPEAPAPAPGAPAAPAES